MNSHDVASAVAKVSKWPVSSGPPRSFGSRRGSLIPRGSFVSNFTSIEPSSRSPSVSVTPFATGEKVKRDLVFPAVSTRGRLLKKNNNNNNNKSKESNEQKNNGWSQTESRPLSWFVLPPLHGAKTFLFIFRRTLEVSSWLSRAIFPVVELRSHFIRGAVETSMRRRGRRGGGRSFVTGTVRVATREIRSRGEISATCDRGNRPVDPVSSEWRNSWVWKHARDDRAAKQKGKKIESEITDEIAASPQYFNKFQVTKDFDEPFAKKFTQRQPFRRLPFEINNSRDDKSSRSPISWIRTFLVKRFKM